MEKIWFIIIILVFMILIMNKKYFLSFLIMMEFLVISMLYYMLYLNNINMWIYLIYMVLSVCEAVLGLSLLVSLNFSFGHQKIELLNLLC